MEKDLNMEKLLVFLQEIYDLTSDMHYNYTTGCNFFSVHKLMDEIREPILEFVDEIKEVVYLGHREFAPSCKEISSLAKQYPLILDEVVALLINTVSHIDSIKSSVDSGTSKVLDDISAHCLKYIGITRRLY